MSRYTATSRNGFVYILDTTTNQIVFTGGSQREADRVLACLHHAPKPPRRVHLPGTVLAALALLNALTKDTRTAAKTHVG